MWHFRRPSEQAMQEFLARQGECGFSYPEVGGSRDESPLGYDVDHNRVRLGGGAEVFRSACEALSRWRMFPRPWMEIYPADAAIVPGQVVAMVARVFGLWWLNACRIVYVIDDAQPVRRFGFAYGTLPGHVERGEERFMIEWDDNGDVWYDLRAFSRPRHWLVRLGYPVTRRMQRRFVRQSQAAMRDAVEGTICANPTL